MLKKILAPVTVVAVLFVGLASSGVASAATTSPSAATAHNSTSNSPGKWLAAHKKQIGKAVVAVSSSTIGVTPQDLVGELRSGKSIAEVVGEHIVSVQTVTDALVSAADAKVNQAVTDQRLTSTQASKIEAALPGYVSKLVNHVFGQKASAHAA